MTRKEAIKILKSYDNGFTGYTGDFQKVVDIAIASLETDAIPREQIDEMIAEIQAYNSPLIGKNVVLDIIHKYTKEQTK